MSACVDALPAEHLGGSGHLGWRSVSVDRFREVAVADAFTLPPQPDLMLVVVTAGRYRIESRKGHGWTGADLHPGSVAATAPGVTSTLRWRATAPDAMESAHVRLPDRLLLETADALGLDALPGLPDTLHLDDPFVSSACRNLAVAVERRAPALYADSVATALAAHLITPSLRARAPEPHVLSARLLQDAIDLMRHRLADELSLAELAAHVHVSPFHFLRLFRRATGQTPRQYLIGLRMRAAADLLRTTSAPIGHVAARCGYSSGSQFAATFRKHFGASPFAYRSSHLSA